jgi:hypothetical protein
MGEMADDMPDDDTRRALVAYSCEVWPDATAREVEAGLRRVVDALARADVLPANDGLPFWFEEWWGEVSGGAPTLGDRP